MTRSEWKARARKNLGGSLLATPWLMAVLVSFLFTAATSLAGSILAGIGFMLIFGGLLYGQKLIFLKLSRQGGDIAIEDLLVGFRRYFADTFLINLLGTIFVFLWSLLLVIPGIVKYYSYAMAYYIKIDHPDYDAHRCLKESAELMRGHRMEKFIFDLSFLGWHILGALCFGIGSFWVTAYMSAAEAEYYGYLTAGNKGKDAAYNPEF